MTTSMKKRKVTLGPRAIYMAQGGNVGIMCMDGDFTVFCKGADDQQRVLKSLQEYVSVVDVGYTKEEIKAMLDNLFPPERP